MATTNDQIRAFLRSKASEFADRKNAEVHFSTHLSVSAKHVRNILEGKGNPGKKLTEKLAGYYGLTYSDLLNEGQRLIDGVTGQTEALPWWCKIQAIVRLAGEFESSFDPNKIPLEDYYAAPLVEGTIAAGPSRILSEKEIRSLVWIYAPELKDRRNHRLVALEIDHKSGMSMMPTLYPGDIVLVDKDDPQNSTDFESGSLYAIRTGSTNAGAAIKRLYRKSQGLIIFSDNREDTEPELSWTGDILKLVIGRVVWGWRNLLKV